MNRFLVGKFFCYSVPLGDKMLLQLMLNLERSSKWKPQTTIREKEQLFFFSRIYMIDSDVSVRPWIILPKN